jgi:hypothetical protein
MIFYPFFPQIFTFFLEKIYEGMPLPRYSDLISLKSEIELTYWSRSRRILKVFFLYFAKARCAILPHGGAVNPIISQKMNIQL